MTAREEAHLRLDELLDALERESEANSEEARHKRQEAGVAALAALLRVSGARDLLRRRTMIAGLNLPDGTLVDAAGYEHFADEYVKGSLEDEQRARLILARHAQDMTDLLTWRIAGIFSDTMNRNHEGRFGAFDMPARRQGVKMRPAWPENVRDRIMERAGYTAGVEFGDRPIPRAFWKRVAQAQRDDLMRNSGYRTHIWKPATARDHSTSGDAGKVFRFHRSAGSTDKRLGKTDPAKLIL